MSVDLIFNRDEAINAGVKFEPVFEKQVVCTCGLPEGECECWAHAENWKDVQIGEIIKTPDGNRGFAMFPTQFQCRSINQEIKDWFILNIKSSKII